MKMSEDLGWSHGVARTGHTDNQNAYNNYAQVPFSIVATAVRVLAGWSFPKTSSNPFIQPIGSRRQQTTHFIFYKVSLWKNNIFRVQDQGTRGNKNTGCLLPLLLDISATMFGALHKFAAKSNNNEDLYVWY
jgi:hypothetical protein